MWKNTGNAFLKRVRMVILARKGIVSIVARVRWQKQTRYVRGNVLLDRFSSNFYSGQITNYLFQK